MTASAPGISSSRPDDALSSRRTQTGERMRVLQAIGLAMALPFAAAHAQGTIEPGKGAQVATVAGKSLKVETYRPQRCQPHLLLLVFHGIDRDADRYRDRARPVADRLCAVIVAPEFDLKTFPRDLYQYGGIVDHGHLMAPGTRTVDLVEPLADWARKRLGDSGMPFMLMGHPAAPSSWAVSLPSPTARPYASSSPTLRPG